MKGSAAALRALSTLDPRTIELHHRSKSVRAEDDSETSDDDEESSIREEDVVTVAGVEDEGAGVKVVGPLRVKSLTGSVYKRDY